MPFQFPTASGVPLDVAFDAGRLTSDGGLPWLLEADTALGLCERLAAAMPDWRQGPVRHALADLVRQRVFGLACGYADQNDAASLRHDPLLKLVCGRLPDRGAPHVSRPTLSRPGIAQRCAHPREHLKQQDKQPNCRAFDLVIAATALEHGLTLVTKNIQDFTDIPGLTLFQ